MQLSDLASDAKTVLVADVKVTDDLDGELSSHTESEEAGDSTEGGGGQVRLLAVLRELRVGMVSLHNSGLPWLCCHPSFQVTQVVIAPIRLMASNTASRRTWSSLVFCTPRLKGTYDRHVIKMKLWMWYYLVLLQHGKDVLQHVPGETEHRQ